jgi:hypothetical protein
MYLSLCRPVEGLEPGPASLACFVQGQSAQHVSCVGRRSGHFYQQCNCLDLAPSVQGYRLSVLECSRFE